MERLPGDIPNWADALDTSSDSLASLPSLEEANSEIGDERISEGSELSVNDENEVSEQENEEEEEEDEDNESENSEELENQRILFEENLDTIYEGEFKEYIRFKPGAFSCLCRHPEGMVEGLTLMTKMQELTINESNYICVFDNIIRCGNIIISNTVFESPERLAFVDTYFRLRHEIMFKLTMRSLNLPENKSDIKFNDILPILSSRTPDFINVVKNNVYIFEIAVTSNQEKAAQSKGVESLGYQSKYEKEIVELKELNYIVKYYPFIYDVTEGGGNFEQNFQDLEIVFRINDRYMVLLKTALQLYVQINPFFRNVITSLSPLLFKKFVILPNEHEEFEDFYVKTKIHDKQNYEDFYISTNVHLTVNKQWVRLVNLLKRITNKAVNYIFVLNVNNSRFEFVEDQNGVLITEFINAYNNGDKIYFYYNLWLNTINGLIRAKQHSNGIKFTKTSNIRSTEKREIDIKLIGEHDHKVYNKKDFNLTTYKNKLDLFYSENFHSTHFDPEYETLYLNKLKTFDKKHFVNESLEIPNINMLCNMEVTKIDILRLMNALKLKSDETNINLNQIPIKRSKMKQPFIYPLADLNSNDYCSLSNKNIQFVNFILTTLGTNNMFTATILERYLTTDYVPYQNTKQPSEILNDYYKERREFAAQITMLYKKAIKGKSLEELKGNKKYVEYLDNDGKLELEANLLSIKEVNKKIKKREEYEQIKKNIGMIRLNTRRKNTYYRSLLDKEMSHFKTKNVQSSVDGVGYIENFDKDHENNIKVCKNIISELGNYRGINQDFLLDQTVTKDSTLIQELKEKAIDDYKHFIDSISNSSLGFATALISRLGHSLLFYSQMPYSSDYIRVDNLGYKNVLLIVRGGKKVFKSKSSKLFRVLYPISKSLLPWYLPNKTHNTSNLIIEYESRFFILTPWMLWHETILTDALSFHTRVCSYFVLNSSLELDFRNNIENLAFNVLLAFHNRRKTEEMLANMRYILVATMGDFSGIEEIFEEFVNFNTDSFNSFCKSSIIKNYSKYFKTFKDINEKYKTFNHTIFEKVELYNIFSNRRILNFHQFTLMIYSTFLMSKAPYQKINERANNMRSILKVHELYESEIGINSTISEQLDKTTCILDKNETYLDYTIKLMSKDFNFDPKYCSNVGNYINSYLINKNLKDIIHSEWLNILSEPWDNMAKSTGLRGEYGSADFWGQKGYMVVYKNLIKDNTYIENLNNLLNNNNETDFEKVKKLNDMNITYLSKINELQGHEWQGLLFHVVDKVQWRGSREIYVMDLYTKTLQQPIEKFMGFLCEKVENEIISIPSDRRSWFIYHHFFEKELKLKDYLKWYLTLDCAKWAPKSLFIKMVCLILNIDILPPSFVKYFMNYCQKLFHKRIYFQKHEVKQLKNNPKYSKAIDTYVTHDENVDAFYLNMEYSWVMGIFNYTSSFMHAANQLYASYIIQRSSIENLSQEITLTMLSHSDDSGGDICSPNLEYTKRALFLYESQLKACNHLLSRKKSVVSKLYFEILSTIFMGNELLPLIAKFAGGVKFTPTDKGMAQDMLQSYSKSIDILLAGGTFSQCYIAMKFYSACVFRFYLNRRPIMKDYMRPCQYLGMPDSHPLFSLVCGTDCDLIRIMNTDEGETQLKNLISFVRKLVLVIDEPGGVKPLKFKINVKNLTKSLDEVCEIFKDVLNDWTIKNSFVPNTAFSFLNFLSKLKDPGFVGALSNESTTRRFSRCYWMRSNDCVMTIKGLLSIKDTISMFELAQGSNETDLQALINMTVYENKSDFNNFNDEFHEMEQFTENDITCIKSIQAGPFKLYKYLNNMSLKGKEFNSSRRTIKPSHIQLIKTAKPFSVKFNASQLVSHSKKLPLRWMFTNQGRLHTAEIELKNLLNDLELDIDKIEPSTLMKLCQNYVEKSVKDIYLYSQIPSEIKTIKTYASFLNFLATNSFSNQEVRGLTINLGAKITDPGYLQMQIIDTTYTIITLLTVILTMYKCDSNYLNTLILNECNDLGFAGGTVGELLKIINKSRLTDPDYPFISILHKYLNECYNTQVFKISADILLEGCFYTFIKEQKSRTEWRGEGKLLIYLQGDYLIFTLFQ